METGSVQKIVCTRQRYNLNADEMQAQAGLVLSAINHIRFIFICNFSYPCQALVL